MDDDNGQVMRHRRAAPDPADQSVPVTPNYPMPIGAIVPEGDAPTDEEIRLFMDSVRALGSGRVVVCQPEPTEAESLLLAMVQKDPFGEWSDGGGVTCWYCGSSRGGCVSGCAHSDARHYVAYRSLLPVAR